MNSVSKKVKWFFSFTVPGEAVMPDSWNV